MILGKYMSIDKYNLDWSSVERALEEGTFSGYKMAVVETEKIFHQVLEAKKIPGKTPANQIQFAKKFLGLPNKLNNARATYQKILNQPHFSIDRDETKTTIAAYYQAIIDLQENLAKHLSWQDQISLRAKNFLDKMPNQLKKISIVIALFSFGTLFLAKTSPGKMTASILTNIADFIIFRIFAGLTIIALILLIIFGVMYFKKRH